MVLAWPAWLRFTDCMIEGARTESGWVFGRGRPAAVAKTATAGAAFTPRQHSHLRYY
jgi:hypothetical protein